MILLDNIIFKLQSKGGVTNVWKSILEQVKNSEMDFGFIGDPEFSCKKTIRIFSDLKFPTVITRYLDISKPQAKIFHSSYFRIHKSKKVKNIVTIHDFTYEKFDKGVRKFIHLLQKKRALKKADAVICVSKNTKDDLLEFHPWIETSKVYVIYNGYDRNTFFPINVNNQNHDKYLLSVGGRNIHKNFIFTLKLMNTPIVKERNFKLVVVGSAFSKQEREMIREMGLTHRIILKTRVENNELNQIYNKAFALVYPSFYEGFGIPPLESMAAGCPVISSATSSLPEVVGDCGLYIDVHDEFSGEKQIIKLLNESFRKEMIQKGLQRAKKFSWKKTGEETINLYRTLLDK